ncbi:MAG: hypothetical protein HYX57_03400 [Chloroflexi bacterium]|nr:hypothetical protein [Chloroflexota bacterium]
MGPRSRRTSAIVALLATILVVAPVAAASPWTTSKQSGTNAYASQEECVDDANGTTSCEGQSIDVFEGSLREGGAPTRRGQQVCAGDYRYTFDSNTGEIVDSVSRFGCALDAGTLTVDHLSLVILAPTAIDLTGFTCDPSGCAEYPAGSTTVSGTWTGEGPVVTNAGRFSYDDGLCVQVYADKGSFRQASFEGSIDATNAAMGRGTFSFRTNCSF